jgi:PAS domain S-box-containing protein
MNPIKILLVDDDSADAELIQYYVQKKLNCEFDVANTKEAFNQMLDKYRPDIILSDHWMPMFTSIEALTLARNRYPGIPFIVVAGIAPEELVIQVMKLGADDYILKGKAEELPAAIEKALRLYESSIEKQLVIEQLRISEKNYHTVFLKSPLPKWIYDSETLRFFEVNEAAVNQYGYSREEFLQMTLRDIRPKEDVALLMNYVGQHKHDSDVGPSLWKHRKKNGQIIDVEINSHTITYNTQTARMAIINDITERKKAEQKILQSEANLKIIFDNTSEGFLLLDKNAIILAFNSNAERYNLFSKTKKFRVGHSIYDYVSNARKDYFEDILEKVLRGESLLYDRYYTMQDGSIHWIEFSVTPVLVADDIKGICFTGHDITEKKKIEQEREFDRNNLKALINNTDDLMWSIDRNFRLITSNEAFDKTIEKLFGSSLPKGSCLMEVKFEKSQADRFVAYYERAFLGESFTKTEYMGKDFWSDLSFYPIYNANEIIGAACFSRNITWQKKAEEERMEYAQSLEEMLFKISHQLRVPIANLLGITHVIDLLDDSDKDMNEIVALINPTVSTLDKFSRDLAKFIETILLIKGAVPPIPENRNQK